MYTPSDMKFRRKFSLNLYKNLKMPLGHMTFFKDWLFSERGDLHPITDKTGDGSLKENIHEGLFSVDNVSDCVAGQARLLGQHFPYATYEVIIKHMTQARAGFEFYAAPGDRSDYTEENAPKLRLFLSPCDGGVQIGHELVVGGVSRGTVLEEKILPYVPGMSFAVTCRGPKFDVYVRTEKILHFEMSLKLSEFGFICRRATFVNATASLWYEVQPGGRFATDTVEYYLDCGVAQADIKYMRYEDGMPIIEKGKIFLTLSARMDVEAYQAVISWNTSTNEFKLEGAIFFDCGDDMWCGDIGSSILYHRPTKEWYIWSVAFSHGHILCHGTSTGDLRYGINVVDVQLMDVEDTPNNCNNPMTEEEIALLRLDEQPSWDVQLSDDCLWLAKKGDEDPDLMYDAQRGKWLMTICRISGNDGYHYFLYESDQPFSGFTYVDHTTDGGLTGGSMVRIGGKLYLTCGANFNARAQYNIYPLDNLQQTHHIRCDYDDGGFRGWGSIIPLPCGSRTRYMWMTFDRFLGSDYNWSYGNLYVFEADVMNKGYDYPLENRPL